MSIISFTELHPEILAAAPACPSITSTRALRTAARNMAERALCLQHDIGNVVVPNSAKTVELDVPSETVLHKPVSLTLNGKPIYASSPALMDELDPDWREIKDTPVYYWRSTEEMNAIVLAPTPSATFTLGLKGQVAVKPARDATGLEEVWMDRFQDVVVDGALGDLLMVRSAPWFDPEMGAYHRALFEAALFDAKAVGDGDDMAKRSNKVRYGGL